MRIAINTLALYKTKVGMGRYIVELINRVPMLDTSNSYIIYLSEENKKFFTLHHKNVIIRKVPKLFTLPFLKLFWEQIILPLLLVKEKIDVYHAPGFVLPIIKPKKTRYVVTIADMTFFTHSEYHLLQKTWYFRALIPSSLKKADKIIAISENTKKEIMALIPISSQKIKTIHLAADDIFKAATSASVKNDLFLLEKYNIQKPYLLFVGMLEPRKNILGILHAFEELKKEKKTSLINLTLIIAGKKGWMSEHIYQYVKEQELEKDVIFTGYVPDNDLPALYRNALCFLYPSFYEGFGIPVIEAMACSCPVITSNNSSLKEIAGDAALLVNPHAVLSIKSAMEQLSTNIHKRKELIVKGKKQAKKFSWQKMAEETKAIYNSL